VSIPVPLLVPPPTLAFKAIAGTYAPLEDVVTVSFAAVRFPDGTPVTIDDFRGAQALLTRASIGGASDVWDPELKAWRSALGVDLSHLAGLPLLPPQAEAQPWQGVLIGAGQKDAAGAPMLEPAAGSFPRYSLRGAFRAKRANVDAFGLGPESTPIEFRSLLVAQRFGAELTPEPAVATRVKLALRNTAAQPIGLIDIDASSGNGIVTIANFDASGSPLASIALQADGSIRLAPRTGMKVFIAGDVETGRIRYLRPNGTPNDLT